MNNKPSIALGTWSWGTGMAGGDQIFGNTIDIEDIQPVFDEAMQSGLLLWDTAAVYGAGSSESILGRCIKGYKREDILISTKFTPQVAGNSNNPVEQMLNESLERLGTNYIDLYWIHNPADVDKWTPGLIPLLQSGKVKQVGVSNHNLHQIRQANNILEKAGYHISAVQNHYSLLYRSSEDAGIIEYCKQNDITFYSYMVLEQGALSGKYNSSHPLPVNSARGVSYNKVLPQIEKLTNAMKEMGELRNASVAQIAIAWAIAKKTLPIIGVTRHSHITDAASSLKVMLSAGEVDTLQALADQTGINTKGNWEEPMM